ncbi:PmeII family type II restriction endonuclease [Aeromonas veronii]|uniref:PmeII family type II restriction endonuclease n=1 Tax=Aeromonas veronii TaxID=654 RepID=UPI000DD06F0A|nr:PmeII family type II restriction endonuclease [Aeromonas veronii]
MNSVRNEDISDFIEKKISEYDEKLLDGLKKLKLKDVLKRKNPYLFKAKGITSPYELIRPLLDAFLSSKEEAVFGGVLEEIAININHRVYGGMKSAAEGIDLEFNKDGKKYLVSIKSGPNWGNSSQIKRMVDREFR